MTTGQRSTMGQSATGQSAAEHRNVPGNMPGDVLVLGGAGRIGQLLRQAWGAEQRPDLRWQSRRAQEGSGWEIFNILNNHAALEQAAAGCIQILCLAGPVPGRGGAMTTEDMRPHVDLALAAVRAAARVEGRAGARVLLASSAAVYGPAACAHEDQPLAPANPYGAAKAEMEARALTLGRDLGVPVTALRIGNIAGFDAALGGWRPGFTLDRFADGSTPRRSYIGPGVLADVLARLMALPELPSALNIAQPGPVAMGDLLRAADREFVTCPAPAAALAEVALDLSRLEGLLGADLPEAGATALVADWNATQRGFKKETP